jgi:hypothetical protein
MPGDMPMVSLKLMAGAARSTVVASARTTAAEIAARWCARKVRGEDRERPYRVESWVVGARACLPSARSARSKVGETVCAAWLWFLRER